MDVRVDRASTGTMWTYGLGSIAVGIKNNLLGTYLLIYYNQVLEVNALLVTAALFIALMIDAFTDPMVGIWSDRVRSKWGRRHPFMYAAIIPFAFSYYYILQDPGNLSQTEHFVRLVFLMFILRLSMTFYEIPRGALAPELTKDYDQRTQISGIGMALGWIGGAGIDYIYRAYYLGESFLNKEAYAEMAFLGGLGIFISTVITTLGTHKHIPSLHKPPERKFEWKTFIPEAKETLSNKSWIVLFCSGCIYAFLVGLDTNAGTYYNTFLWQFRPDDIAIYGICMTASIIFFSMYLGPLLARGIEKKKVAVTIFMTSIFLGPLPILLRLIDTYYGTNLFPENGTDTLWWIMLFQACITATLGSLGFIIIGSMTMDIVEDVQRTTQRRSEGLLGTVSGMVHKIIGAGGTLLAGVIITMVGFDDPGATLEFKQTTAISEFSIIHVICGFVFPICSTLLILLYNIKKDDHLDNVTDLGYVDQD